MSATTSPELPRERALQGVTLPRVTHSEWTKLWTLRSTRWSLFLAFVAQAGLGPLIALIEMSRWSQLGLQQRLTINPIDHSLGGWHLAQLAVAILGVMTMTGEYHTGMIRSSFMAAPKRLPVLWAKLLVFSAVTLVLMVIAAFIGFLGAQAIFAEHHVNVTLGAPDALRAIFGVALVITATGAMCVALGTIVRRTAGGIALFVGVFFVLPGLVDILPSATANALQPYLPSTASSGLAQALAQPHSFTPWGGFALFCGYTVAVIVIAAVLLKRRDA
ncbi:ABC transporter permease subunit [Conexibacter sp. S30A1]|uniref:ABC transporter permease subunit n=1 Tax=Conexibacter sp. S30A1 TaxID=2937800 RepID=UPI00200BF007|nr:ABC transporter permease subunit [Conexibacter sp. S30A1]